MSEPVIEGAAERVGFDPQGVVEKWLPVWDRLRVFEARDDGSRERRYIVDMFPYPSGDLHMGHAEAFSIGDAVARHHFTRHAGQQQNPDCKSDRDAEGRDSLVHDERRKQERSRYERRCCGRMRDDERP